jgi:hypothetical protein
VHPLNPEPRSLEESVDGAIQVAAAGERLPEWREPVLPPGDAHITRATMLDEEQPAPDGLNTRRIS